MADIGYQPPATSAAEILQYKGDPALAGGFDSKGQQIGTEGLTIPVQNMLSQLQGQQFQRNMLEYNQAIKDRDQSMAVLSDPSLQVDMDIHDKDRPELEAQRQKLINMWKSDPSMDDVKSFTDFQREAGKFREMAVSSKSRNLEFKKQMQSIAGEPNTELRKAMISHLDAELNNGVMHQVTPYFKNPSFDAGMFADIPMSPVGEPQYSQKDGLYSVTKTMRTPVRAFTDFIAPESLMANNGEKLQKIQLLHDNFVNSPFAQDDNNLTAINTKLASINAANKLTAADPAFLQPIAVKGDAGWKVNESPAQFAKSLYAYSHYNEKQQTDLSKDVQQQKKIAADIAKTKSETYKEYLTAPQIADKYKEEARLARIKGDIAGAKAAEDKMGVSVPASDGIGMFKQIPTFKSYEGLEVDKQFTPKVVAGLKAIGYTDGMTVTPLPRTATYVAALSVPQNRNKTVKGVTTAAAAGQDVMKPTHIIAINGDDGDINSVKIIGFDKNGEFMKAITIKDAAGELIKAGVNFKTNDATLKRIDAARNVTNSLLGETTPAATTHHDNKTANNSEEIKQQIAAKKYDKVIPMDNKNYYKIGDNFYDEAGNIVIE